MSAARETADLYSNLALKSSVVRALVDPNGIECRTAPTTIKLEPTFIAEQARNFTFVMGGQSERAPISSPCPAGRPRLGWSSGNRSSQMRVRQELRQTSLAFIPSFACRWERVVKPSSGGQSPEFLTVILPGGTVQTPPGVNLIVTWIASLYSSRGTVT